MDRNIFEELIKFKYNIKTVHSTIKFEFNFSLKSIIFLDTIHCLSNPNWETWDSIMYKKN